MSRLAEWQEDMQLKVSKSNNTRKLALKASCASLLSGCVFFGPAMVIGASSASAQDNLQAQPTVSSARHRTVRAAQPNHGAAPPESSQSQTTSNKPANSGPSNAGILPFVPPFFTQFPTGEKLIVDTKGIQFNAPDDAMKFRIGGRFQEDFSSASINPRRFGPALADNGQGRGIDTRRAFFEAYLSVKGGLEFAFQYDFNSATAPIQDAVVSYHTGKFGIVNTVIATVGNFKEPFSLNQLQSDNTTTFTERSLMDSLVPGRSFGGAIGTAGSNWTVTGGVYGGNANTTLETNGIAGTGRVTYAPILTDNQVLHFGFAGSYRELDRTGATASFASKPEDFLFSRNLVTTGTLANASDIVRFNAEALYQYGPWRVQGEYTHVDVDGFGPQRDRSFEGGYVEGAWVINGKGRTYRVSPPYGSEFAVLQGVAIEDNQRVSQGGYGVFEVAARYSALDLNSRNTTGGHEEDFTAGLNWYPDRNIRFMADYVHAETDPSGIKVAGVPQKVDSDLFVGRVNFSW